MRAMQVVQVMLVARSYQIVAPWRPGIAPIMDTQSSSTSAKRGYMFVIALLVLVIVFVVGAFVLRAQKMEETEDAVDAYYGARPRSGPFTYPDGLGRYSYYPAAEAAGAQYDHSKGLSGGHPPSIDRKVWPALAAAPGPGCPCWSNGRCGGCPGYYTDPWARSGSPGGLCPSRV